MAITQEFRQAVQNKDTRMVRIMLKDSLVVDPTFVEFKQMNALAESSIEDLYDKHDDDTLKYDTAQWTKDYMDDQMVQVVYNFSKERIDLLKKICRHLYGQRAGQIEKQRNTSSAKVEISKKKLGTGLVVGGAVATVVGIAAAETAIAATGVAIGVVGGILILNDK